MAINDDIKITINLNELVEIRAKLISQYDDYSEKISKGEYLDGGDIDRIATKLRDTLTWDALYSMVDEGVLEYLGMKETHYGETAGNEPAATYEKNRKQFDIVKLESPSWTIEVPVRKKK
tara:strand:+ start:16 stop:375 length:360 start_codon:yes stop_codon:yes gene_type:complete